MSADTKIGNEIDEALLKLKKLDKASKEAGELRAHTASLILKRTHMTIGQKNEEA